MNVVIPNFYAVYPEIFLLEMVCVVMLVDVFLNKYFEKLTYITSQIALVGTFFLLVTQYHFFSGNITTFSGQYVLDRLALLTKFFVVFTTVFAFIYARQYLKMRRIMGNEYYILGLLSVLGMMVMSSAASLLAIYLGLELLSLALYAMIALDKNSHFATEAAMKYFVMGAMASGLLLYGISLIYGATGAIDISGIAQQLQHASTGATSLSILGMIFLLAGLLFKFGAVPFHMWVPDVYEGAPTCMTLFIACAPKIATFSIAMRILAGAMPEATTHWQAILVVIAMLSMFSGNVLAIAQTSFKRLLAYSSIAHMGYMLLGLIAGPNSSLGYSAAMFYIVTYVLVAAGAFAVIALLAKQGAEFDHLNDLRGLNARHPWLAFMMLLLMFSMAGVPPTVGFFAKLGLLEALVQAHYVWLAAFALLFAIIGAYYYLRVVMLMYFEEPTHIAASREIKLPRGALIAISLNGFAALALGLLPSALIDLCRVTLA